MDPTRLRAEFRRRTGRELRLSDAQLSALIEAYGSRRRRRMAPVGPQPGDGYPSVRWSNEALDYPHGIEDPPRASEDPPPDATVAAPVGELPIVRELREAMIRHPSAFERDAPSEMDRRDLSLVHDPDGPPTYSRTE